MVIGGAGSVLSDTRCQFVQAVGEDRRGEWRDVRREMLDIMKGK